MKGKNSKPSLSKGPPINKPRPKIMPPPPSYKPQPESAHFLLVKLQQGSQKKILKKLKKVKDISGFHPVFGQFDLVLIIRERKTVDREKLIKILNADPNVLEVQTLMSAS
jgi:hypothetical protein